jgi:hypothetical protein
VSHERSVQHSLYAVLAVSVGYPVDDAEHNNPDRIVDHILTASVVILMGGLL